MVSEDRTQKVPRATQAGDCGLHPRYFICVTRAAGDGEALCEVTPELEYKLSTLGFWKLACDSRCVIEVVVPHA
jgi:hypothetical protein